MPEDQNVIGDLWLDKTINILKSLGWEQHGDKKTDIETKNGPKGIDAYFTYYDPYEKCDIGLFIEAKTRQWQSTNSSFLSDTISKMSEIIQEVPSSSEFNAKLNFNSSNKVNSGFFLLWVNDDGYDDEKFQDYLKNIEVPKKWHIQKIFVASNGDIQRFCSIIETTKELINLPNVIKKFQYYYPSLSGPKNLPQRISHLTLESLYSKYIFGEIKIKETIGDNEISKNVTVVFFCDEISLPSLKLLYNALLRFQLLDEVQEVWIYLYQNDPMLTRSHIEEFKRYLESENPGSKIKYEIKSMKTVGDDILNWSN